KHYLPILFGCQVLWHEPAPLSCHFSPCTCAPRLRHEQLAPFASGRLLPHQTDLFRVSRGQCRYGNLGKGKNVRRLHVLEIEDQAWCPRAVRDGITDYLQFALAMAKPYAVVVPPLAEALRRTGTKRVVDLCSGAAGPWLWLQPALAEQGLNVSVCLTDRYP